MNAYQLMVFILVASFAALIFGGGVALVILALAEAVDIILDRLGK